MDDAKMGKVGIPYQFKNVTLDQKKWPGKDWKGFQKLIADPQQLYDSNTNIMFGGADRGGRTLVASWLAQNFGDHGNAHYRLPGEHKRMTSVTLHGEVFTQPFKVKMMDTVELENFWKECQRDDDRDFAREVVLPDFFFLKEVGYGSPSVFTARIIEDLLIAREDEQLPIIATLNKKITDVKNWNGDKVFTEIARYVNDWKWVPFD